MEVEALREKPCYIRTAGGPLDGEMRQVDDSALGWPPPINLPGIFHRGAYIRQSFDDRPEGRVAEYQWAEDREFFN